MARMTGEGRKGLFVKHKGGVVILDDLSATYLWARSEGSHKTLLPRNTYMKE
jgi:hypothetical protein